MHTRQIAACLLLLLPALGCKASSPLPPSVTIPTAPGPAPTGPFVNMAGNWVGTLESANMETETISMVVVQFSNCVDGSWRSSSGTWSGAISGFAGGDSYSGQISFERSQTSSGGGCIAGGEVTGPVGADSFVWTGTGATAIGQCAGVLPQSIRITMRRQ